VLSDLPCTEVEEAYLSSPDVLGEPGACLSIDVDYYFKMRGNACSRREMCPEPIEHFQRLLRVAQSYPCVPLFVALTPHCCGGWQNVLPFVKCIDRARDLDLTREIGIRL